MGASEHNDTALCGAKIVCSQLTAIVVIRQDDARLIHINFNLDNTTNI
jgi:hypothetical protein